MSRNLWIPALVLILIFIVFLALAPGIFGSVGEEHNLNGTPEEGSFTAGNNIVLMFFGIVVVSLLLLGIAVVLFSFYKWRRIRY